MRLAISGTPDELGLAAESPEIRRRRAGQSGASANSPSPRRVPEIVDTHLEVAVRHLQPIPETERDEMTRTNFSELRKQVEARPGSAERLAAKRAATLEEIRDHEDVQLHRGEDG